MMVPRQSEPVERIADGTLGRDRDTCAELMGQRFSEDGRGIVPAGYDRCYRLRGLAQQLCLSNY